MFLTNIERTGRNMFVTFKRRFETLITASWQRMIIWWRVKAA